MRSDRLSLLRLAPSLGASIVSAGLSINRVLTYDEAYWLAIARRMIDGAVLYVDVVDNKGPLLYVTFALLDVLPGGFEFWRVVTVASAAGLIAHMGADLLEHLGVKRSAAAMIASVTAVHGVALSSFALSTELMSAVLVVIGFRFRSTRPAAALACVLIAAGFDPRSLLFAIPLGLAMARTDLRRRTVGTLAASAVAALVTVFAVEPLRFALVELSTATRFGDSWVLSQQAFVAVVAVLPLVGLAISAEVRADAAWQSTFGIAALLIGSVSLFPFSHYWVYLGLVPLVLRSQPRNVALTAAAMVALVVPALVIQRVDIDRDQRQWDRAHEAAALIANRTDETDRVVVWSELPQLTVQVVGQTHLSTPSINILGWDTSRSDQLLEELAASAASAEVILVDATLDGATGEQEPFATIRSAVEAAGCDASQEPPFACFTHTPSGESSTLRTASS